MQFYAAGTRSYGELARPLLKSPALTDDAGNFAIPGGLSCPSSASEVYLVATGGHAVLEGASDNPAISLMSGLGLCGELGRLSTVTVNEVTTIASVYALNAFLAFGRVSIGAPLSNQTGLANAFITVKNLVDLQSGSALSVTPAGNGRVPQAAINTLANIFSTCADPNGLSGACGKVFAAATPPGQPMPATILQAALQIAMKPFSQAGALYALAPPQSGPYAPALPAAPNDWSISVSYTGGSIVYPQKLAIDALGDVWIADPIGVNGSNVTKLSNAGVPLSGPSGFTGGGVANSSSVALDSKGDVWVTSSNGVTKLSNEGAFLSGANGFTSSFPIGTGFVAIDPHDNAWLLGVTPAGVVELDGQGNVLSGSSGYSVCSQLPCDSLGYATAMAFDPEGNAFVTLTGGVAKLSGSGGVLSGPTGFVQGVTVPSYAAVDHRGVVWVTNTYGNGPTNSVTRLDGNGNLLSTTECCQMPNPAGVAIDGRGYAWVVNYSNALLNELDDRGNSVTGFFGYFDKAPLDSYNCTDPYTHKVHICYYARTSKAVAIDGSGDVWVSGNGSSCITEYVGLAFPVVTPLTVAVRTKKLGRRP